MITVKRKVHFTRSASGRRRIVDAPPTVTPIGRVPRVAKLMALAIRFEGLLRQGIVSDQSELARLAKVTQPRMTQILNLLHLAPRIQEELLFLPRVATGRDPVHERMLRVVCAQIDWRKQLRLWSSLRARPDDGQPRLRASRPPKRTA